MTKFPQVWLLLLAMGASRAAGLEGFTYMSPTGHNAVWKKLPIRLCVTNKVPPRVAEGLAPAMEVWNQSLGRKVFEGCHLDQPVYKESDPAHGVYWITEGFEKYTDKTSLARTTLSYEGSGEVLDGDILLNGQYYDWSALTLDPQTIFVHELGHMLGLKHFFLSLDSAMNYYPYASGYEHRTLGAYEKLVFGNLYGDRRAEAPEYLRAYFAGQLDVALKVLAKIKKPTPAETYALAYLSKAQGKPAVARKFFRKLLSTRPGLYYVRQQLADALWSLGDLVGAEKEFQTVLTEQPRSYESLAGLGAIYIAQGDAKRGQEFLKKSLEIQPAHWVACQLLLKATGDAKYRSCVERFGPAS